MEWLKINSDAMIKMLGLDELCPTVAAKIQLNELNALCRCKYISDDDLNLDGPINI